MMVEFRFWCRRLKGFSFELMAGELVTEQNLAGDPQASCASVPRHVRRNCGKRVRLHEVPLCICRWLKLGFHEEPANRVKVAELLRYNTSDAGDEQIRLAECTARMKDGQTHLYYITGKSIAVASSSPVWTSRAGRA